ncbi:MAG: presqualene diphosphate synthase HpnD [Gammaproteobacteria bacterium]|nr:presqualene diphosphate synthase HpnD [Gammaproteobacteria bacterium]
MLPVEYCRQKVAARDSSFHYCISFLQSEKRDVLTALYAYFFEVSEIIDECREPAVTRIKLEWWHQEVNRLFDGSPSHPVAKALHPIIQPYALTAEQLLEVIEGMHADIEQPHYNTAEELASYCRRVGTFYDSLLARTLGYTNATTGDYARKLGAAFRFTQIIRDVAKDAQRGRTYIPMEDLQRFEVPLTNIVNRIDHPNIATLIGFEIERAKSFYDDALDRLAEQDRLQQLPGLVMAAIYRATLDEIERDGCRVLKHRIALPPMRKRWIAWKTRHNEVRRARQRTH